MVHVIVGLDDGGAEAALYRLCTAARSDCHHVISLTDGGKYGSLLSAAGITVTCLKMSRGKISLHGLWTLWRHMRRLRPDVVQTWMYHADLLGGAAARLAGIRNICWGVHNSVLIPKQNAALTIVVARLCARLSFRIPRTIVCCARKAASVHAGIGYRKDIMRVIPNGYDLSLYRPSIANRAAVRAELGLGQGDTIGFVARYDPAKDHDNLLRSLALLRRRGVRPRCLLVGTGMDGTNAALAAAIAREGVTDQLILLGRRDDVAAIMNALDIHVLSSCAEAFPNVLAEAMACGTPCITTDVGDAADIVGGSGWIVDPGDPVALAAAIEEALSARHHSGWSGRQQRAREWIEESFSLDRMVADYRQAWFGNTQVQNAHNA